MRKIILGLTFLALLAGCGRPVEHQVGTNPTKPNPTKGFVKVAENVYCDTEYNVQYLYFNATFNNAVLSVRLDSNGNVIPCYKER